MNIDLNTFDDRAFKNVEFSLLQVGDSFYSRKPRLTAGGQDDTLPYKKITSVRNSKGNWVNAVAKTGHEAFIPYDKKVLVVEKK